MDVTEMNVRAKLNEAEVYLSQGLLEESLLVYEQIHSKADALAGSIQQSIANKISKLRNEIRFVEQDESNSVSENEIVFFKETLSITDEIPDLRTVAGVFMELGLYKEALREYGKLLCNDRDWRDIIPNTTECLLKSCSSDEIFHKLDQIIQHKRIEYAKKSEIKFLIGQELEKRNFKAFDREVYDSAHPLNPHTNAIKNRIKSLNSKFVKSLVYAIEAKDRYTAGHSERVSKISMLIAEQLDLDDGQKEVLTWAAILHDVGKIGIPDSILNKPDRLDDEEYDVIKGHPIMGYNILLPIDQLKESLPGILYHHERYDGKGYPGKLTGVAIPLVSRIIAVADTFDAISSSRAYRPAKAEREALDIVLKSGGTQLDPQVVEAFEKVCQQHIGNGRR
jgi:HD-GYP domain-containing protein (c-di-GMP phosphodiesterase class II)